MLITTLALWCRMIVISTNGGGPLACHPEILKVGTVHTTGLGWGSHVSGWWVDCSKGGPFKVTDGFWFCRDGAGNYFGPKDIPDPPMLPELQGGKFWK